MSTLGTASVKVIPDLSALSGTAFTSKMGGFGKKAGVALAGGLAAAGAVKFLYDVGQDFDNAFDKIQIGTGKTGKKLKGLENDFRSVFKSVPVDADTASTAITELEKRLDLHGKPLRRLAKQELELSRITKTDLNENIESTTRLFGDWSIKTGKQTQTLDKLFRLSQNTGISISDLSRLMVQFGSPLRQLGLDFDTSAAMFAKFEKEGVNIQTLMPGLRFGLKTLSGATPEVTDELKKMGVSLNDPAKALQDIFALIKKAPSDLKANALAFKVFGVRAGPDMAAAIREGRFELDDLIRTMDKGHSTIRQTGKDTMDAAEQWQLFKNNVELALEPLASKVFDEAGDKLKDLRKIITDPHLTTDEKLTKVVDMVGDAVETALPKAADKVAEFAPHLAGSLIKGFLNADAWGKVALGAVLLSKFGLTGPLLRSMGAKAGTQVAVGMEAGMVSTGAGEVFPTGGKTASTWKTKAAAFGKTVLGTAVGYGVLSGLGGTLTEEHADRSVEGILRDFPIQFFRGFGINLGQTTGEEFSTGFQQVINENSTGSGLGFQNLGPDKAKIQARIAEQLGGLSEHTAPIIAEKTEEAYQKGLDRMRFKKPSRQSAQQLFGPLWDTMTPDEQDWGREWRRSEVDLNKLFLHHQITLPEDFVKTNPKTAGRIIRDLDKDLSTLKSGSLNSLGDIEQVFQRGREKILESLRGHPQEMRNAMAQNMTGAIVAIGKAMDDGEVKAKDGMQKIRRLLRERDLITGRDPLGIAKGFAQEWRDAGHVNQQNIDEAISDLKKMPPHARDVAGDTMIQMARQLARDGKLPRNEVKDLVSDTAKRLGTLPGKAKSEGSDFVVQIGRSFGTAGLAAATALDLLGKNVNSALKPLGQDPLKFVIKKVGHALGFSAKGGFAGQVPGYSRTDDTVIGVRGGEAILRPEDHQPMVEAALRSTFGIGLQEMFQRTGAHAASSPGTFTGARKHFASGGFAGMQPEITALVKNVIKRFGGFMSSGYRPGDDGFHGRGLAADWVGGDWTGASRYMNQIGPQLLEGIHQAPPGVNVSWDSGHQVPPSFWGSATWAEHVSHIHMATTAAIKALMARLPQFVVKGPDGAIHDATQAAIDLGRREMQSYLNKQLSAGSMDFAGMSGNWVEVMHKIAEQRNWSFSDWMHLVQGESGGDPNAVNPSSGATGLGQMLGSNIAQYNGNGTPVEQIEGMARYISDRYGNPTAAYRFWLSQSPHWYKGGGFVGMENFAGGGLHIAKVLGRLGRRHKPAKRKRDIHRLIEKIKDLGLPKGTVDKLTDLNRNVEIFDDLATRASDLSGEGHPVKVPGPGGTLDQAGWLKKELGGLWDLRKTMIKAQAKIQDTRDQVEKAVENARKRLKDLKHDARKADHRLDGLRHGRKLSKRDLKEISEEHKKAEKRISALENKKHLSGEEQDELQHLRKANRLRERMLDSKKRPVSDRLHDLVDSIQERQKGRHVQMGALQDKILPALRDQKSKVASSLDDFVSLDDIQGPGSTKDLKAKLKSPVDSRFGGELLRIQLELRDLGQPSDELAGLNVGDLQEFARLVRVGAFDTDAFGTLPTFHEGGQYRATRPGGEGLAIVKDREWMIPDEDLQPIHLAGPGGRQYELVITNWQEGRGYIRELADGQIARHDRRQERASDREQRVGARLPSA